MADVERRLLVMLKNDSVRNMPRKELAEHIETVDPTLVGNQAHYIAGKIKRAAQRRDLGFYEALKILGIYSDTTARDALQGQAS